MAIANAASDAGIGALCGVDFSYSHCNGLDKLTDRVVLAMHHIYEIITGSADFVKLEEVVDNKAAANHHWKPTMALRDYGRYPYTTARNRSARQAYFPVESFSGLVSTSEVENSLLSLRRLAVNNCHETACQEGDVSYFRIIHQGSKMDGHEIWKYMRLEDNQLEISLVGGSRGFEASTQNGQSGERWPVFGQSLLYEPKLVFHIEAFGHDVKSPPLTRSGNPRKNLR